MAGIPTRTNFNAREQIVSTDLNRIGNLAGREAQDAASARSVRADFYLPATNSFDDIGSAARGLQATPISGTTIPPSLDGKAGMFDMDLGAGEADVAGTSADPDESGYHKLRWPAQTLTWPLGGVPDPTNPRICLICATPNDDLEDIASRNILLDPATRSMSPENVYKTSNPVATISVEVGTAAAVPVPPAVPAGALALFEVWIPAAVADSTSFVGIRRAWRRIDFPGSSQHGVLKGCELEWGLLVGGMIAGVQRIVIDGELLTFETPLAFAQVSDSAHTPPSAPASNDAPSYMYLCGGRHQPIRTAMATSPLYVPPVVLVESTVAPDLLGYPTANLSIASPSLTFPRAACCFVGLRFRAAGSTSSVPSRTANDWIYADQTLTISPTYEVYHGFKEAELGASLTYSAVGLGSLPNAAAVTFCDLRVSLVNILSSGMTCWVSTAASDANTVAMMNAPGLTSYEHQQMRITLSIANAALLQYKTSGPGTPPKVLVAPIGYQMRIPRLGR